MLFSGESLTFANFLADAVAIFVLILWFWLFITTASDLSSSRHDISGFGKVIWVILLIVLPYIGIFAYILTQGGGMAERNRLQARQARDELRQAVEFSAADELVEARSPGIGELHFEGRICVPESAAPAVAFCRRHGRIGR